MRAVSAAFIEIKTSKFTKKVQVDPYLEDSLCSLCAVQHGPYYCRELSCFRWVLSLLYLVLEFEGNHFVATSAASVGRFATWTTFTCAITSLWRATQRLSRSSASDRTHSRRRWAAPARDRQVAILDRRRHPQDKATTRCSATAWSKLGFYRQSKSTFNNNFHHFVCFPLNNIRDHNLYVTFIV